MGCVRAAPAGQAAQCSVAQHSAAQRSSAGSSAPAARARGCQRSRQCRRLVGGWVCSQAAGERHGRAVQRECSAGVEGPLAAGWGVTTRSRPPGTRVHKPCPQPPLSWPDAPEKGRPATFMASSMGTLTRRCSQEAAAGRRAGVCRGKTSVVGRQGRAGQGGQQQQQQRRRQQEVGPAAHSTTHPRCLPSRWRRCAACRRRRRGTGQRGGRRRGPTPQTRACAGRLLWPCDKSSRSCTSGAKGGRGMVRGGCSEHKHQARAPGLAAQPAPPAPLRLPQKVPTGHSHVVHVPVLRVPKVLVVLVHRDLSMHWGGWSAGVVQSVGSGEVAVRARVPLRWLGAPPCAALPRVRRCGQGPRAAGRSPLGR